MSSISTQDSLTAARDLVVENSIADNLEKAPLEAKREPEVNKLFRMVMKHNASDLHLKVGQPPMMRMRGDIQRVKAPPMTQEEMERLLLPLLKPDHRKILDNEGGVDFSYVIGADECRFRVSLFKQRGKLSLVSRRVNSDIPSFKGLGLPDSIELLCNFNEGLVILAGVTGSGKSTTIASMLNFINEREPLHILTIEDPIEFTFTDAKSYINQREIGLDSRDWHKALKDAVRQDPDVMLIGELRDIETFEAAVHAAETGHLVFGTIHASSAATTINRILDLFPPEKHGAIRKALANNLKAVVAQKLLKGLKKPRIPTNEIMIVNPTIRKLIGEGEDMKIQDAIKLFYNEGMIDFTENLRQLVDRGDCDKATALEYAPDPEKLKMAFKGIKVAAAGIL
ncbi:PilT/PilU family type 4a pilus ATPase [Telmatocola sphagniphila]|uniref:PilT/PilU family type 4a pilus ATPase n=1 Tax=Telmatocola sphagniphila TaxID=1123043 RepID=A0A8E6EW22_9BACT|nr:PilT/PilU family type 4a pilus ATPase [Telmatocola sphagniphila]QVL33352.1 PilT/PilU family type 4a pilus ATPase [Telmatocola sphagniphila]